MTRFAQTKARFSFARIIGVFCAALVACVLALGVQTATSEDAFADESKSYSYTVTLYAGNGTIDGAASKSYGPYGYGKSCTIAWQTLNIQPDDDKYYVKGIRLAGHDGLAESGNIEVTQDLQYVVAYGMKKDQVAYTINYVDANGAQIADSETFYGNIGDKPVIAYRYIEGYQPTNAYNLTGTLNGNAEDNVFTFKYQAVQDLQQERPMVELLLAQLADRQHQVMRTPQLTRTLLATRQQAMRLRMRPARRKALRMGQSRLSCSTSTMIRTRWQVPKVRFRRPSLIRSITFRGCLACSW